jgi:inosine-uridine nucleoside N-ribohydrolase
MIKLHLDTDIGGDIDDLCALALVLNWPDVELLAVTTNLEDQGVRAGYARYALRLAGRDDVPIAAGADRSLGCFRINPDLPLVPDEEMYWPEPIVPAPSPLNQALYLLERSIEQGAIIAAIGAFTNLALLEKRSPGILSKSKLYLMGGYVFPPREGYPPWGRDMDWNAQVDVQSAQTVIEHSSPTLIPISVTVETSLRRADLSMLRQSGPLSQLIARQAEAFAKKENFEVKYGHRFKGLPEDIINFQHDPLACAIALGWNDGVETSEIPLKSEIKEGWLWQSIDGSGKPTRVVTGVEGDKFNEFWLTMVAGKNESAPVTRA